MPSLPFILSPLTELNRTVYVKHVITSRVQHLSLSDLTLPQAIPGWQLAVTGIIIFCATACTQSAHSCRINYCSVPFPLSRFLLALCRPWPTKFHISQQFSAWWSRHLVIMPRAKRSSRSEHHYNGPIIRKRRSQCTFDPSIFSRSICSV